MNGIVASAARSANVPGEAGFEIRLPAVRAIGAVMQRLHGLFPKKFNAHVAVRARVSTRAVDFWTTKNDTVRANMSAEAFIGLLQSDVGAEVLEAVMTSMPANDRPRWWLRHSNTARLARVETLQAEAESEIKQLRLSLLK